MTSLQCSFCTLHFWSTGGVVVGGRWFCSSECRSRNRSSPLRHSAVYAHVGFRIDGVPAPKGSFRVGRRRGGGVSVRKDSARTETWHQLCALAASRATLPGGRVATRFYNTPLSVKLTFYLPRPESHFAPDGTLRRSAPAVPAVKPDLDKLERATLDGLAITKKQPRGLFDEDSRVVMMHSAKLYATELHPAGCDVAIWPWGSL